MPIVDFVCFPIATHRDVLESVKQRFFFFPAILSGMRFSSHM